MPDEVRLRLRDASPGEWVIIAIDGVTDRRYLYRDYWRGSGGALSEFSTLTQLRTGTGDGYYQNSTALYVKLYVQPNRHWAAVDVCDTAGCG